MNITKPHPYWLIIAAILIVYFCNMFIDVMQIDAAQYSLISMEMSETKSFLQVYQYGKDYLDKPPLLFWLSSVSFMIFGISNFAYKLPSILIFLLGIYSTYQFAKSYYSKKTSVLSALILASSQASFLITNDVRTDTMLLGWVMFSVWQLNNYLLKKSWKSLLLSAVGIAAAMMSKGPIALIIPLAAFGSDMILKRDWKKLWHPQWIALIIVILILLLPMSYGLYTQFDLHPEKSAYNLQSPSGLRFFYWTQSFGRITGEIYWDNNAGFFFFFHSILWDFQPWLLFFIPALVWRVSQIIKQKALLKPHQEAISTGGFILVFLALSLSKYKLPHYIFVIFPFSSIITADFILRLKKKHLKPATNIQFSLMFVFWALVFIELFFIFPTKNIALIVLFISLFICFILAFRQSFSTNKILIPTLITIISFNLMMAISFYPNLLKYQSSSQAGKMANTLKKDHNIYVVKRAYAFDFYTKEIIPKINLSEMEDLHKAIVYIPQDSLAKLPEHVQYKTLKTFPSYRVTQLSLPFLNPKTRTQCLEYEYLIELK